MTLYGYLARLDINGRKRVYARWEHLKMILPGDGARWEKEFKRLTK